MQRVILALCCAFTVALSGARAYAGDADLSSRVEDLSRRADALQAQHDAILTEKVDRYLKESRAWRSAEGGDTAWNRIHLHASLTSVLLGTLDAKPGDRTSGNGRIDLDFRFDVTENLQLFLHGTGGTTAGSFPALFGPVAGVTGATLSGLGDGIGVDGTVPVQTTGLEEAGVEWQVPAGDYTIHLMAGKLDPRRYYALNDLADDPYTQFLNNLFDDPPAITWRTTAGGPIVLGAQAWMEFGDNDEWRADVGFYSNPGRFFNKGTGYYQLSYRGEWEGRPYHVRLYGAVDSQPKNTNFAIGLSGDLQFTEKVGFFARATGRFDNSAFSTGDPNPIESDWSAGAVFTGLFPGRPKDNLGIAGGIIKGPIDGWKPAFASVAGNREYVVEMYYRYMAEGGHLQVSPVLQLIFNPGAKGFTNRSDLILLGVRVYVPF